MSQTLTDYQALTVCSAGSRKLESGAAFAGYRWELIALLSHLSIFPPPHIFFEK